MKKLFIMVLALLVVVGVAQAQTKYKKQETVRDPITEGAYTLNNVMHMSDDGQWDRYTVRVKKGGQPYWEIGPEDLAVLPEAACLDADGGLLCEKYSPPVIACYRPCIRYGPEFTAIDTANNVLYLNARASDGKNAPRFLFRADLRAKAIQYLTWIAGPPARGTLSPDGRLLAVPTMEIVQVVDTKTKSTTTIDIIGDAKLDVRLGTYSNDLLLTKVRWAGNDNLEVVLEKDEKESLKSEHYKITTSEKAVMAKRQ